MVIYGEENLKKYTSSILQNIQESIIPLQHQFRYVSSVTYEDIPLPTYFSNILQEYLSEQKDTFDKFLYDNNILISFELYLVHTEYIKLTKII
jgi:hypothetical protein